MDSPKIRSPLCIRYVADARVFKFLALLSVADGYESRPAKGGHQPEAMGVTEAVKCGQRGRSRLTKNETDVSFLNRRAQRAQRGIPAGLSRCLGPGLERDWLQKVERKINASARHL